MIVEFDEDFIYVVLEYFKILGVLWLDIVEEDKFCDDNIDILQFKQQQFGKDIYFEVFNIQFMQFDLFFVCMECVNVEDKILLWNFVMFFFNVMIMVIGNINDVFIWFNVLMLENVCVLILILIQNILNYYS